MIRMVGSAIVIPSARSSMSAVNGCFASAEVRAAGWGGLQAVHEITGLARSAIGRGLKDLDAAPLPKGRVRRKGGGRRHLSFGDGTLIEDLRRIVEPVTLGCPVRPLLWVSK